MKRRMKKVTLLLCIAMLSLGVISLYAEEKQGQDINNSAYMILIIDDFGNNTNGTKEIAALPIPITGAVIPGMPNATHDAQLLVDAGKEVIIHVPLEPVKGKREWLGEKGILVGMGKDKVTATLTAAIEEIPGAVGMNNHMGSRAMKDRTIVDAMMSFAKEKAFYFVDSGTTDTTLSKELSDTYSVDFYKRDVFLDDTPSVAYVEERLRELATIAKEQGIAVGIGHVGVQKGIPTATAIANMIPVLEKEGITFITVSQWQALRREAATKFE